jgi:hypothetical protein
MDHNRRGGDSGEGQFVLYHGYELGWSPQVKGLEPLAQPRSGTKIAEVRLELTTPRV